MDKLLNNQITLENQYVMHTFGRKKVEFVKGEGVHLYDTEGNKYLDFLAGIAVCSLGHCPKCLVDAINDQASKLMHVSNYFYIEKRGEVAKQISNLLNNKKESSENWKLFFANSGAEANECALKIARKRANRRFNNDGKHTKVLTLKNSFHGRTLETLAATAQERFHVGFNPMSVVFDEVEANNKEQLIQTFDMFKDEICAMIIEPVQGESGVHPLDVEYIQIVRELTSQYDALMICDEVQTGVYRTGHYFAFQGCNIIPDIVTIAKGVGGGFPVGICAARGEASEEFNPGDHGSTFGGSNLSISAISATLSELDKIDSLENVRNVGNYFAQQLSQLKNVIEVRGCGLMIGAELDPKINAFEFVENALYEEHLVLNATNEHTLRFLPPLIINKQDVDECISKMQRLLV